MSVLVGKKAPKFNAKVVLNGGIVEENFSLEQWEEDAGFVLACQLQPSSKTVVLDFDAA